MSAPVWDGIPENPERDGWHLWGPRNDVEVAKAVEWSSKGQYWHPGIVPESAAKYWHYIGPLIFPADHAAAVEAARKQEFNRVSAILIPQLAEALVTVRRQTKRIERHRRIITRLLAMRHDTNTRAEAAVQAEREATPKACDGKEQFAFEAWAKRRGFDLTEHPLHYLFLDERTDAARDGWRSAIQYVQDQIRARGPTDALAGKERGEVSKKVRDANKAKLKLWDQAIKAAQAVYPDDYEYGITDSDMEKAIKAAMVVLTAGKEQGK